MTKQLSSVACRLVPALARIRDPPATRDEVAKQREEVQCEMPKLTQMLRQHFERLPERQRERRQEIRELDRNVINLAIRGVMSALQVKYHDHPAVSDYLTQMERDLEDNPHLFQTGQSPRTPFDPESLGDLHERARYEVNLLVDNSAARGAPIGVVSEGTAEKAVQNLWGVKGVVNNITMRAPPQMTVSDVKAKIEDAYRRHAQLDADSIRVSLDDGTLTLSGEVHSLRERNDAEAAAWAAPGVTKVDNRLHVQL